MTLRHRIVAICVLPLVAGVGQADDAPEIDGNFSGSLVIPVDREATESLELAEDELQQGETTAGLVRLQQLLDRPADVYVERRGVIVSAWESANQVIASLPAAAQQTYERLVRIQAEKQLEAARLPLDESALARLVDRYRQTPVGRESALLLAALALDRGDEAATVRWGRFLLHSATTSTLSPAHAGRLRRLIDADSSLAGVDGQSSPQTWAVGFEIDPDAVRAVDNSVAELDAQALTPILTCHPLIVNQRIVARTLKGLICIAADSGELQWEQPVPSHASQLAGGPGQLQDPIRTGQISAVLLRRLVRDSLQDELSSDGELVFTIMTGEQSATENAEAPVNTLRAVDLTSGMTRWELGPSAQPRMRGRRQSPPANARGRFFLGPPLVDGEQLLILAQQGQSIELVALHRSTGETLWTAAVGQAVRDLWARESHGMETPPEDRERQSTACLLSRSGSRVLCSTGAGAIACIDIVLRRLIWAYRYPRRDLSAKAPVAGDATHFREMPTRNTFVTAATWIIDDVGLCLAPDADRLLGLSMTTGELLWSQPRRDLVQVIPVDHEFLIAIGHSGVTAVRLRDGSPAWHTATRRPVGRGIVLDDQVIVPVVDGDLDVVRISDGSMMIPDGRDPSEAAISIATHPPAELRPISLRNLQAVDDDIVSQSAVGLERFSLPLSRFGEHATDDPALSAVLAPVVPWRVATAPVVELLRCLDSRAILADGALLSLLQHVGLKQSRAGRAARLVEELQRAESADEQGLVESLRRQLTALEPHQLYVTTADDLHSCRLDRWLKESPPNTTSSERRQASVQVHDDSSSPWPAVVPRVSERPSNFGISYFNRVPVLDDDASVWRDVTVEVDRQGRMVQLYDARHSSPRIVMLPREVGTYRLEPDYLQGWAVGDVLLLRIGTELVAFRRTPHEDLPAAVLWPANGRTLSLTGSQLLLPTSVQERSDAAAPDWDRATTGFVDVFGRGVGDVGPVRRSYFCYQQRGDLICRHTQTGEELWRRTRWPVGTRAVGDDTQVVLFHPTDSEVTVLDASDGRTLHRRTRTQRLEKPVTPEGARFVPTRINGVLALVSHVDGDESLLEVMDLTSGQSIWRKGYSSAPRVFDVDDVHLGVITPASAQGAVSVGILNWQTGEAIAVHDLRGPDELREVWAIEDARGLYVIASGRITDLPLQNIQQIRGGLNRPVVNGWLHAFEKGAARHRWSQPLENLAFPIVQPRHVPLLVINDLIQPRGTQSPQGRLICLDAHTGETLFRFNQLTHVYYALAADPQDSRVELRMRGQIVEFDYSDESTTPR